MIKSAEIQQKSREVGVRDQQIEKDYILSWILKGVSNHEVLSKILVFKGGTVLKKIYFEDYRFSEDLDFTLLNIEITNSQIFSLFKEAFQYIIDEANIPLDIIDDNEHEDGGINFYISNIGPLGGQGNNKKVKVDISKTEKLEFEPIFKPVFIEYFDLEAFQLLCYQLEEVLVEKLRAVMHRMQARDFYDIWYLLEMNNMDASFYLNEFAEKCKNKGLNPKDFHKKLLERLPQYKARWQGSMSEQIENLPSFDRVERELIRSLKKMIY